MTLAPQITRRVCRFTRPGPSCAKGIDLEQFRGLGKTMPCLGGRYGGGPCGGRVDETEAEDIAAANYWRLRSSGHLTADTPPPALPAVPPARVIDAHAALRRDVCSRSRRAKFECPYPACRGDGELCRP